MAKHYTGSPATHALPVITYSGVRLRGQSLKLTLVIFFRWCQLVPSSTSEKTDLCPFKQITVISGPLFHLRCRQELSKNTDFSVSVRYLDN